MCVLSVCCVLRKGMRRLFGVGSALDGDSTGQWRANHAVSSCDWQLYMMFCYLVRLTRRQSWPNKAGPKCPSILVTCEAARFYSSSNRTSDSGFDSYWWSGSKFPNRPHRQSSFVKKRLAVVKFAFKVEFGSKIIVQRHSLTRFRTEFKWITSTQLRASLSFVTNTK